MSLPASGATKRARPDPNPGEVFARSMEVRAIDEKTRSIEVVASTDAVDLHGTILVQDWEEDGGLDRFRQNPVILWAHNASLGLDELPIGRASETRMEDGKLVARIEFAPPEVSELAERCWNAYRLKFLRAVSVGFWPRSYRWEERDGREVLVLFRNILLEISCVPIGSNPDALARSIRNLGAPSAPATENDDAMELTEEQKRALEFSKRALELLGEKDTTAGEARLRGLIEVEKAHEKAAPAVEELRAEVSKMSRAALIEAAVRDGKLPPKADLETGEEHAELRSMLDALSPLAPAKGQRSPLEAYLRTLPRRTPATAGEAETPKGQKAPDTRKAPAATPRSGEKYRERAKAEKDTRRARGHGGPRVTDAPAEEQESD